MTFNPFTFSLVSKKNPKQMNCSTGYTYMSQNYGYIADNTLILNDDTHVNITAISR